MKANKKFQIRWLWLIAALFAAGGCATTNPVEVPGTLRGAVNLPPASDIVVENEVSQAFVDRVREAFHEEVFTRPVVEDRLANPTNLSQVLTLNLINWRMTRVGNIECTFTAALPTPAGTHQFGVYNSTLPRWFGGR